MILLYGERLGRGPRTSMQQPEPQPDPPQAPAVAPPELPTPSEHEAVPPPAAMSATPVQHGRIWTWLLDNNHPLITTLVTLATLISCFSAVIVIPEVRSTLGLDQPAPAAPAAPLAKNDPVVVGVTVVLPSAQVPQEALPTTASLYETTAQTPVLLGSSPAVGQPPVVAQGQQRYRTIATSDGGDEVAADERTWVYVRSGGVEGWMSTRYLRFPN